MFYLRCELLWLQKGSIFSSATLIRSRIFATDFLDMPPPTACKIKRSDIDKMVV